ncbi:MAG: hypothetical protein MHM6MM_002104 [Cercozoa sp. M6MM]
MGGGGRKRNKRDKARMRQMRGQKKDRKKPVDVKSQVMLESQVDQFFLQQDLFGKHENAFGPSEEEALLSFPVPRRPLWKHKHSDDFRELAHMASSAAQEHGEEEEFGVWQRKVAQALRRHHNMTLTPFERNLSVWRELWRTTERTDVIIEVADARNPLLFRAGSDLREVIAEARGPGEGAILLLNKADLLSVEARQQWFEFFKKRGIRVVFFSALLELRRLDLLGTRRKREHTRADADKSALRQTREEQKMKEKTTISEAEKPNEKRQIKRAGVSAEARELFLQKMQFEDESGDEQQVSDRDMSAPDDQGDYSGQSDHSDHVELSDIGSDTDEIGQAESSLDETRIFTRSELLRLLRRIALSNKKQRNEENTRVCVGCLGFPNVGKSCVVNVLCAERRVAVSSTPFKTKRLQTINIPDTEMSVFDCPGLVFAAATSQAELAAAGILPADRIQNPVEAAALVVERVSKRQLERHFHVKLDANSMREKTSATSVPSEDLIDALFEAEVADETAEEMSHNSFGILSKIAAAKNRTSKGGRVNENYAAKLVLQDAALGRLVYCHPPPTLSPEQQLEFVRSIEAMLQ